MSDTRTKPYFPEAEAHILGKPLTPFRLVALVCDALRKAGVVEATVEEFRDDALSGEGPDHPYETAKAWVTVR